MARSFAGLIAAGALLLAARAAAIDPSTVPELSGEWGKSNFNLEQPANGPVFITNTIKKKDGTLDDDAGRLGDYKNPLLTPEASAVLKAHGEFSMTGQSIPDPHNQCWPEPPPFTLTIQLEVLVLQRPDEVVLVYVNDQKTRHIRLNSKHSYPLAPTLIGDSIGHYEGDTLVVDTVGIKPSRWPVLDRYGTPHSDALHVVERYRLVDGQAAADAILAHHRTFTRAPLGKFDGYGANYDNDMSHKGLQVEVTVEDPKMFTQPWKGMVTYRPETNWPEMVCADSLLEIGGPPRQNPVAEKRDF